MEINRLDVRYPLPRADLRGHEEGKIPGKRPRPWLVLSDFEINEHDIFVCVEITHAGGRSHRDYLVDGITVCPSDRFDSGPHFVDAQQLWTFALDSDQTSRNVATLEATSERTALPRVLAKLARRLSVPSTPPVSEPRLAVGNVVWIELLATDDMRESDLLALQTELAELAGVRWPYRSTRLPCVIVATAAHERELNPHVLALVSVVPLVDCPRLRELRPDYPTVSAPDSSIDFSILTQLVLTVDYRNVPCRREGDKVIESPRRVYFDDGDVKSWMVDDKVRDWTLRKVRQHLGVRTNDR